MQETLFYILSSFWVGAVHAATPGHGKTIAAAYIVGARGRPIDAVILGVFVTLSHTTGIVLVGVLASLGSVWLVPHRVEAYLALATVLLVIASGCGCCGPSVIFLPWRWAIRSLQHRHTTPAMTITAPMAMLINTTTTMISDVKEGRA